MAAEPRTIRIAIAQALSGKIAICGPDDSAEHSDAMDAAICWLIEAGDMPANRYWVTVNLPAPSSTEIDLDAVLEDFAHD